MDDEIDGYYLDDGTKIDPNLEERERITVPVLVCETKIIGWTPQGISSTWLPTRGNTGTSPRIITKWRNR